MEKKLVYVFFRWEDVIEARVEDLPLGMAVLMNNDPGQYIQTLINWETTALEYAIKVILHEQKKQTAPWDHTVILTKPDFGDFDYVPKDYKPQHSNPQ